MSSASRTNEGPGGLFFATIAAFFLTLFYVAFGATLLQSCIGSPSRQEKTVEKWNQIVADGRISKEEADEFATLLGDRDSINWPVTLGTIAAALIGTLTGVRRLRTTVGAIGEAVESAHERIDTREAVKPVEPISVAARSDTARKRIPKKH